MIVAHVDRRAPYLGGCSGRAALRRGQCYIPGFLGGMTYAREHCGSLMDWSAYNVIGLNLLKLIFSFLYLPSCNFTLHKEYHTKVLYFPKIYNYILLYGPIVSGGGVNPTS
jgi:hypothetical protein